MRMRKYFPKEYSFFPLTWLLPTEYNDLKSHFYQVKGRTYIVKPEAMSQGKGIYLTKSLDEIEPRSHCVVQRYISDPYLIDGLKFDLRIYVLLYGCDPFRIYVYKEGLARLATEEYEAPNRYNLEDMYIHLTNYAINKHSENFIFNTDENEANVGNKRSLQFVWNYIHSQGGDPVKLKQKINKLIVKTFCAVQPQLAHPYRTSQPNNIENNMCFEILGFDILIDNNLTPWLLEVNHSPSFNADTPFDYKVKSDLIYDTIKLVHLDPRNKSKFNDKRNSEFKRVLGKTTKKPIKERFDELKKAAIDERDEYELKNLGGFTRIYPDSEFNDKYEELIDTAKLLWEEFYGYKKYPGIRPICRKPIPMPKVYKRVNTVKSSSKKIADKSACKVRPSSRLPTSLELSSCYHKQKSSQKEMLEDSLELDLEVEQPLFPKPSGNLYV